MIGIDVATKEDFLHLEKKISQMQEALKLIVQMGKLPDVVRIKDIARMENVSETLIRGRCRYLLPRFGVSAYEDGSARWPLDEYLEWRKIDPKERKWMWMDLSPKEKQKIIMGKHYHE